MKQLLSIILITCCTLYLYGQGTVQIGSGVTVNTTNGAYLVLDNMHLLNQGTLQQKKGDGTVLFTGTADVSLRGNDVVLDRLQLTKSGGAKLNLLSNMAVVSEVNFQGGLLDLGNHHIDLGSTGLLTGESESSRAFTTGSGFIQARADLNAPSSVNAGNLGAVISTGANLGQTVIRRGHEPQTGIAGSFSSVKRYYDIAPANNTAVRATLRFQYFDAELNGIPEADLNLWRSNNSSWTILGTNTSNATANYVDKNNVQRFARMTLAPGCSINVTIPDVYAVSPGGDANTLYVGYGPGSLTLAPQVSGGTAPYTFKWTEGSPGGPAVETNATFTVSPTTVSTYYVSVSDAYGCSSAAVFKTIKVVDVRCGTKNNMVLVCGLKKGSYTTQCVPTNQVESYLTSGGYLGNCQASPALTVSSNKLLTSEQATPLTVHALPNPASDYFKLITSSGARQPLTIRVVDAVGRLVEMRQGIAANGALTIGGNYRPGIYYAEVVQGNEKVVVKLIKQSN